LQDKQMKTKTTMGRKLPDRYLWGGNGPTSAVQEKAKPKQTGNAQGPQSDEGGPVNAKKKEGKELGRHAEGRKMGEPSPVLRKN